MRESRASPRAVVMWVVVLGYAAVIFWLSSIPAHSMPEGEFWKLDKLVHAGEYALLAALIFLALRYSRVRAMAAAVVAAMLAAGYGVSDEIHQSMVPGRFASPYDALADILGAGAAAGFLWWRSQRHGGGRDPAATPRDRG